MSKIYVFKTLVDCDNPRELYDELKDYGLNVTDTGDKVYVYGDVQSEHFEYMMRICRRHGTIAKQ